MKISVETKIHDLLVAYPFLEDFLVARNSRYKNLKNPLMRNTIGRIATIRQVALTGREEAAELVASLQQEVDRKTREGFKAFISKKYVDPDRQRKLKEIVLALHDGEDPQVLKKHFADLIDGISPAEIADLEQSIIDDGMPEKEVRRLCDLHVALFEDSLDPNTVPDMPPGHPVHTYMLENRRAEQLIRQITELLGDSGELPEREVLTAAWKGLAPLIEELGAVAVHYTRKENQLFPVLEEHGVTGPSKVMWTIHDDIRGLLKKARIAHEREQMEEMFTSLHEAMREIGEMIFKEEHILFPMSLEIFSDADWERVRHGEEAIGFAWIEPPPAMQPVRGAATPRAAVEGAFEMRTGLLDLAQINLMLTHLPVDISFVDEQDKVLYYSDCAERIFPRSPGVIGRAVQNCHPAASVESVDRILNAFRNGEKTKADFWINFGGRFILIQYFAVVDGDGRYRGCLEVAQDVTEIRRLEGEKRLLDWQ